jgi:hypothetical protein
MDIVNKKPLVEIMTFEYSRDQLVESLKNNSSTRTIVKGILQKAEEKNQNGRVYPVEVLRREVDKYNENFVKQKRALGELDHPDSEIVNLKNVSHNILKMWWEGNNLLGEVEILTTPSGNILKELLKCGITVGISSRGSGSVKKVNESTVEVNDDYSLIAFDFVSNPSTFGAFMFPEGGLNESKIANNVNVFNKWASTENIIRDILNEIK